MYTECKNNLGPLEHLLHQIRVSPNVKELVIDGDLMDEWFVSADVDTYNGKDQADFVQRIALTNKGVFKASNQIITDNKIKVTYVPGNHDMAVTAENIDLVLPGIIRARDLQQGLGTYTPADMQVLAIEHGHRYNFSCAPDPYSNATVAPGSIFPTGYFFTRIAALHVKEKCSVPGEELPFVTPNANASERQNLAYLYCAGWDTLMKMYPISETLDEKVIVTNINGFTANYSLNDLVPFQLTPGGDIDMNLYQGVLDNWEQRETQNGVAVKFSTARAIADADDNSKTDVQAQVQYFLNPESTKRIVVFGHTHQSQIFSSLNYMGEKSIYANSGTWIDSTPFPTTMNFVIITPQNSDATSMTVVKLYNFMEEIPTLMKADSLRY